MRIHPFLITGCGRSGTQYVSHLLSAIGVSTGWEAILQPIHPTHAAANYPWLLRRRKMRGDSNWLSVPYIARLPQQVRVLHLVRHPLLVIRSLLALRFFGDQYLDAPSTADPRHGLWVAYHLREIRKEQSPIERAMHYWVYWNCLCEKLCAKRRYTGWIRLEDLAGPDGRKALAGICKMISFPFLEEADLPDVPNVSQTSCGRILTWSDLPDGELKLRLTSLAHRYGYDTEGAAT